MNIQKHYLIAILVSLCLAGCGRTAPKETVGQANSSSVAVQDWGTADGMPVRLFTLRNASGMQIRISSYGGIITEWMAPDRNGTMANIVLGFETLDKYLAGHPYFGALIGRYGNRIANGQFSIGDSLYTLATNDGKNHLHGGQKGFDKRVWEAEADTTGGQASLKLHYISADKEEGYPGTLEVSVVYTLTNADELLITYEATTDKPTHINLTNHAYFNLTGDDQQTILNHTLMLNASKYTPVDRGLIPTGELVDVAGTPFDFTKPEKIGARIDQVPGGYDHNFVLDPTDMTMSLAAFLYDSASGRKIETYTSEPGIQFYSGNFLNGSLTTSEGKPINKHTGLCLETQHFPDSPNQPNFPSTLLQPGETYKTVTKYAFKVE